MWAAIEQAYPLVWGALGVEEVSNSRLECTPSLTK
jgi:hypothetical protein